jgi:phosphate transport system substrate-binding protein
VNVKSASKPYVKDFIKFYLAHAAPLATEIGSVPLPAEVYQLSYKRFLNYTKGSMFENKSTVGVNLLNLLSDKN